MATYISSNANRFYVGLEDSYGQAGAVQAANRVPAVRLSVRQKLDAAERRDKTGSRTYAGAPGGGRRRTQYELQTYLTTWQAESGAPAYGPMFEAALGAAPQRFDGGTLASTDAMGRLQFEQEHGISPGQAVSCGGEIRFATAIVDSRTVQLNAPFTAANAAGTPIAPTVTYNPATDLKSVSIFDYWSPETAVQRAVTGAAIDELEIAVNGDYHEFRFRGPARDVIDSSSYSGDIAELQSFPTEPALGDFDYSIVPGHMGQVWLGTSPTQFFTLTKASVLLKNDVDLRAREFGSKWPRAIAPGRRSVTSSFELYSMDDEATRGLYQAARQQSPISLMLQLGEVEGQLVAVYLKSVMVETPEFNDEDNRLRWAFRSARAQGTVDDEIAIAFG